MTWNPTALIQGDVGSLQVVIGGVDVTFWRGVACQIMTFSTADPFGDSVAQIDFPQITPFEAMPGWYSNWANVEINLVGVRDIFTGQQTVTPLWEGLIASIDSTTNDTGFNTSFHCVGALFQLDNYVRSPAFHLDIEDIGTAIYNQFRHIARPGLRTAEANKPNTGIGTSRKGFWNPVLTGYIQDLLSYSTPQILLAPGENVLDMVLTLPGDGYWMVGSMGTVDAFGPNTHYFGSIRDLALNGRACGIAPTYTGNGYWLCGADGGVFALGDAPYLGNALGSGNFVDIQSHPSGYGYWLLDDAGQVYSFGVAAYHGGGPGTTPMVAFSRSASGGGYAMLDSTGHVYAYGDAGYHGGASGTGYTYQGIANRPQNDGYWLVGNDPAAPRYGYVFGYGAASATAWAGSPPPVNAPAMDIVSSHTGNGYAIVTTVGSVYTAGDGPFFGTIPSGAANVNQWTLTKLPGRIPHIMVRDRITEQWHMTTGTPGLDIQLSWDMTQSANAIYGEGVDTNSCHWRNSRFPRPIPAGDPTWPGLLGMQAPTPPPTFPTTPSPDANTRTWQQQLHDTGWPRVVVSGFFDGTTDWATKQFQAQNGIGVTGIVNAQTWAAAFQSGGNAQGTNAAYFAALSEDTRTQPALYDATGATIGANPHYDPSIVRKELFASLGEKIDKLVGVDSAENWRIRSGNGQNPGWSGRLVLTSDPEEGSRFLITAGQNIVLKSWHGASLRLHIAQADISISDEKVTLTVDSQARDLMTLGAVYYRDIQTNDLGRRQRMHHRVSRMVNDTKATWDCEAGSGIIPRQAIQAGLWNVIRIPAGERGDVAHAQFKATDTAAAALPCEFAVGVFDAPVSPSQLSALQPTDPATGSPSGAAGDPRVTGFWDAMPDTMGLIIGWGGNGNMCGYFPLTQGTGGAPKTGVFVDDAIWYFQSTVPPWLWVALWCDTDGYIEGSMYPNTTTE